MTAKEAYDIIKVYHQNEKVVECLEFEDFFAFFFIDKNIGDDEMADTGQKDYVIDLAEEKKVHAGHLCEEMFDHEFDKATVGEVNEMIRVLNRV